MRVRMRPVALAALLAVLPAAACSSTPTPSVASSSTVASSTAATTSGEADDTDTSTSSTDDAATSSDTTGSSTTDSDDTDNGDTDSSDSSTSGSSAGAGFDPCALLTQDQIKAQVGGTPAAGHVDPNDATHCIWEVPGSTFLTDVMKAGNQTVEVGVSMGTPIDRAGFDGVSKQVGNTPVTGVGDAAYFNSTLFNVDFLIGGNQYDVEMPLIGAVSPDSARTALVALAKEAAAKL